MNHQQEYLWRKERKDISLSEWVVDEDGDVFTRWLCPSGTPIDPKHIRRGHVLMYCPPLDTMAPPEKKTVYVDVSSIADDRYPHSCPRCGRAAYVGLFAVDCKKQCPS